MVGLSVSYIKNRSVCELQVLNSTYKCGCFFHVIIEVIVIKTLHTRCKYYYGFRDF